MNDLKAYAIRSLNRRGRDGLDRRRWAGHGSTRWLWRDQDARDGIRYVVEKQGETMAVFLRGELCAEITLPYGRRSETMGAETAGSETAGSGRPNWP